MRGLCLYRYDGGESLRLDGTAAENARRTTAPRELNSDFSGTLPLFCAAERLNYMALPSGHAPLRRS